MNGTLIQAEREQLDHQRARLEEILSARDMVSADMRSDLEQLLGDITQRLWELNLEQDSGQISRGLNMRQ